MISDGIIVITISYLSYHNITQKNRHGEYSLTSSSYCLLPSTVSSSVSFSQSSGVAVVSRRDVSPTVGNCLDSVTDSSTGGGGEGDEWGGVIVVCRDGSNGGVEVGGTGDGEGVDG